MKKRSITSIIVFLVALTAPCPDGLSQTQTRIYTSHERKQDEKEQREPSKTERRLTDEQADYQFRPHGHYICGQRDKLRIGKR